MIAAAFGLLGILIGVGIAWHHFSESLGQLEDERDDLEHALKKARDTNAEVTRRAEAAEQSLELVLTEGDRDPLTAPVRVVRGGAR